jgi:FAD/FMN-containing dehydrogenase
MNQPGTAWGRLPGAPQRMVALTDRFQALPDEPSMLTVGNGRSYGDVGRNDGGALLTGRGLDRFIGFDPATGRLECEAGVLLSEIIDLVLPSGWFPPVTPGTRFVTVGGAIANDVHGKNHHRAGSFGNHILEFELLRSDGQILRCSRDQNPDWFAATVGGLGLTGLIRRATLQLKRVPGPWIRGDSQRFANLKAFFAITAASDGDYEYTVAWLDCSATGANLGRGIFIRGNHAPATEAPPSGRVLRMPITPPISLVNSLSLRAFNTLYYHRPAAQVNQALWHYRPFFYPLDGILEWNRMYGPSGFYQYQCALPTEGAIDVLSEMLGRIGRSGLGSFLLVLKTFGAVPSLGMLSFPRPGATLALDFPNRGAETLALLNTLDDLTRTAGGAVYPAKDARMSAASFQSYFPAWQAFSRYVDPKFSSSFWRRVTGDVA